MAFGEMQNGRSWMGSVRVSCTILALSLAMLSGAAAAADSLVTIYKFKGIANGAAPYGKLAAGSGKNLYGTTYYGGTDNNGTIFRMVRNATQTAWIQTVIYRFKGGTDGSHPIGDLAVDDEGNLYGTTIDGGASSANCSGGCGTVFRLSPNAAKTSWTETILHRFTNGTDGAGPQSGIQLAGGVLYGTTYFGGTPGHFGTVFRLKPKSTPGKWLYEVLYSFKGGGDGANPEAGVTLLNGNIYGTTTRKGRKSGQCSQNSEGCGTIFKLTRPAVDEVPWPETPLYLFSGQPDDGTDASGRLVVKGGIFYGTTHRGGTNNCGTIFRYSPSGMAFEQVLYDFKCGLDGKDPQGVTFRNNTLLGVTLLGGHGINGPDAGTVFSYGTASDTKSILHRFSDGADGGIPQAPLLVRGDGVVFGTTYEGGGASGGGTVFSLFEPQ